MKLRGSKPYSSVMKAPCWRFSNELPCLLVNRLRPGLLRGGPGLCRATDVARTRGIRPRPGAGHHVYKRHADSAGAGPAIQFEPVFRHRPADQPVRLRQFGGHGQVPAARRGDRAMIGTLPALPFWLAIPVSLLLVLSGILTLTGSLGLLRLPTFY